MGQGRNAMVVADIRRSSDVPCRPSDDLEFVERWSRSPSTLERTTSRDSLSQEVGRETLDLILEAKR